MKKITLLFFAFVMLSFTWQTKAQTLNQNAGWPNAAWTVTGTYNVDPLAFEADPTTTANFAFDDDDAGNGSDDDIAAESPVIDLTAAHTAGETWITVSGDYVYNYLDNDELKFQYWDADGATWTDWGFAFTVDTAGAPTDGYCAGTAESYTSSVLNIVGLTGTQLSGFKYRISYNDDPAGADWNYGFCFQSPTITSATPPSCPDPTTLAASNIAGFSADLSWVETGSATVWDIELVDITAAGTATGTPTATGVTNPYSQTALVPSNDYEFYVRSDCGASGGTGVSNWVGPFAFSTTVACPDPSGMIGNNVTTNSADLSWTPGGSETAWNLEWLAGADFAPGTGAAGITTATAGPTADYSATGLTANTTYFIYYQADCVGNGTSNWVGPFQGTTACTTFTAPYTQDFENAGAIPACWSMSGAENWVFSTTGGHVGNGGTITGSTASGSYFAYVDDSSPDNTGTTLLSPFVDVSGLTTPALSFFEISNNEGFSNVTLTVDVWDGAAWNNVGTYNTNTAGWEQKFIDLSGLTITGPVQARFVVDELPNGDFYDDVAIDDVSFDELPSCTVPSVLTATNITETSADLGWTAGGSETLWDVELVDITAAGTATGTPTATGVANPYMQTGLIAQNDYEFYVRADCGVDGVSDWAGPFAFTTPCATETPDYTEDFTTFLNPCWEEAADGDLTAGPASFGSANWLAEEFAHLTTSGLGAVNINMYLSSEVEWLITPFFDLSGGGYEVVVDVALTNYNSTAAGTFDPGDAVSLVYSSDGTNWTTLTTWNQANTPSASGETVITDISALTGSNVQFAFYTVEDPADSGRDIDFHLDNFKVRTPPSCAEPTALTAANVTTDSADLGWTDNAGVALWDVELVDITAAGTPTGTPTNAGVTTNPLMLTGLVSGNDFEFYVRADCGTGVSTWTGPFAFSTLDAPLSCGDTFVDTGDTTADYSSGENVTWSICPGVVGDGVLVNFTFFSSEDNSFAGSCYDGLTIYDGLGTGGATIDPPAGPGLPWCWDRDDATPAGTGDLQGMTLGSTDASGCLTFVFTSDSSATREGWEADITCAALGVEENNDLMGFAYYPNPVKGTLNLNAMQNIQNVSIINVLGQEVIRTSPNNMIEEIDMSSLQSGAYFVKVTINGATETVRVIKQ